MSVLKAERLNALKAKVKAEMLRRSWRRRRARKEPQTARWETPGMLNVDAASGEEVCKVLEDGALESDVQSERKE